MSQEMYVATGEICLHKLLGTTKLEDGRSQDQVGSVILVEGDMIGTDEVPDYVNSDYDAGLIPLLRKHSPAEAVEVNRQVEEARAAAEQSSALPPPVREENSGGTSSDGAPASPPVVETPEGEPLFISGGVKPGVGDGAPAVVVESFEA